MEEEDGEINIIYDNNPIDALLTLLMPAQHDYYSIVDNGSKQKKIYLQFNLITRQRLTRMLTLIANNQNDDYHGRRITSYDMTVGYARGVMHIKQLQIAELLYFLTQFYRLAYHDIRYDTTRGNYEQLIEDLNEFTDHWYNNTGEASIANKRIQFITITAHLEHGNYQLDNLISHALDNMRDDDVADILTISDVLAVETSLHNDLRNVDYNERIAINTINNADTRQRATYKQFLAENDLDEDLFRTLVNSTLDTHPFVRAAEDYSRHPNADHDLYRVYRRRGGAIIAQAKYIAGLYQCDYTF